VVKERPDGKVVCPVAINEILTSPSAGPAEPTLVWNAFSCERNGTMVRMLGLMLLLATLPALGALAAGEPPEKPAFLTAGGGLNRPFGDAADTVDGSYTLCGSLGLRVAPHVGVGAVVAYDRFTTDIGDLEIPGAPDELSSSFTRIGGFVRVFLGGGEKTAFFLRGEVGNCHVEGDSASGSPSESVTVSVSTEPIDELYAGGGIGLQIRGENDANLTLEAMYHNVFGEEDDARFATLTASIDIGLGL